MPFLLSTGEGGIGFPAYITGHMTMGVYIQGFYIQGGLHPGIRVYIQGVCIWEGVSSREVCSQRGGLHPGGLLLGGLHPGALHPGVLLPGVCIWGVSARLLYHPPPILHSMTYTQQASGAHPIVFFSKMTYEYHFIYSTTNFELFYDLSHQCFEEKNITEIWYIQI